MNPFACYKDTIRQLLSPLASLIRDLQARMQKLSFKARIGIGLLVWMVVASVGLGASSALLPGMHTQGYSNNNLSTWMAESVMCRQEGIMTDPTNPAQALQAGITQKALIAVLDQYPDKHNLRDYLQHSTDVAASYMASTAFNDLDMWPLDRLSTGNAMVLNGSSAYNEALAALSTSIAFNQRNKERGLWYWRIYPQWSYLDGMYSYAPFAAIYNFGRGCADYDKKHAMNDTSSSCIIHNDTMADIQNQFALLWQHCRNATTGLLYHGYDASKKASWAQRSTGSSTIVWGRSLGWYTMALVDAIELLPHDIAARWGDPLLGYFQDLIWSIMKYVDPVTGGWYQVVDQGQRKGNYIESSATAMFSYALLKGVRLGYIHEDDADDARNIALRAHRFLTRASVVREANGTLGWNGTVGVCSLNSSATYEYYTGQPIDYNNPFGAGAYILASIEVERLIASLGGT
ncbi:hypothetical protein SLS53_006206 [Cytospora paraplurivora]|uniref:Uncharacterized protein n=1 Tax=Cytospora paraplurivora TaxID=2898453 RepID=A0AAN9U3R7_9PEZI